MTLPRVLTPMAMPRQMLVLLAALAACAPAFALDSDKDKPLDVNADTFAGGPNDAVSVLTGHVKLTQGSIVGTGDKADIHTKDKVVNRVVLVGAPATLKQDIEGGGQMDAKAKTIDYDVTGKRAVLTGNAVVKSPSGEAHGEHLTYEVDTGKMTGDGQGGDGQVHIHFVPQPKAKKDDSKKDESAKEEKK